MASITDAAGDLVETFVRSSFHRPSGNGREQGFCGADLVSIDIFRPDSGDGGGGVDTNSIDQTGQTTDALGLNGNSRSDRIVRGLRIRPLVDVPCPLDLKCCGVDVSDSRRDRSAVQFRSGNTV